jgi:hypothetical protein
MTTHWDIPAILCTLFMVGALSYWITRRRRMPTGPLGKMQSIPTFLMLAFGLSTFFMPLATTDPPILAKTEWSALDLLSQIYSGKLPFSAVAFDIASTYLLMLLALAALLLPRPRKPLLLISILGIVSSSWALEMGHSLLFSWFTRIDRTLKTIHVSYAIAVYALEIVMSALLLIAIRDDALA